MGGGGVCFGGWHAQGDPQCVCDEVLLGFGAHEETRNVWESGAV